MGQAIDCRILRVPFNKTVSHEMCFDRFDGTEHAWIVGREKANQRHHQEAGVEMFGSVILHKRIQVGIKTLTANLLVNGISELLPSGNIGLETALFRRS